jgi:isoleucyl-tRNA synthetase
MKPVWWSIDLETALAEAELTYKDNHTSTAAYVKFPTFPLDGGVKDIDGRVHTDFGIAIWTTTPWTLPANRAVAINKSLDYVIISTKKLGNILVGASKVHQFAEECTEGSYEVVSALIKGAAIIGKVSYRNPFELDTSPGFQVIHANFVSATEGTGLVHCAPGHGLEDFEVCKSVNIKAFAPVDEQGRFTDLAMPRSPAELTGRRVLSDGLEAVLRVLENQSLLLKKMEHTHKYPYEWRQNSPVIVRATPQWFVDLGMIKDEAMRALINVTFLPESGRDRLENFIKDRKSWCISRQRAWGVPIPALYDRDTGEPLLTKESVDHIIKCIEHRGTEAWFKDDLDDPYWVLPKGPPRNQLDDLLGSHSPPNGQIHPHPKCQSQYVRRLETMDVWFDSGSSWTQIQPKSISEALEAMEARQFLPANVYVEGSDQHRGWFQSSLLTSVAWQLSQNGLGLHSPQAPFKKLITHGFVLDEHRQKMSKSVGNVIKPSDVTSGKILREHCFPKSKDDGFYEPGSDGLRLWVATSDFTKDVTIGPVLLYDCHLKMAKLRATVRFLLGNLQDFQYGKHSGSLEYNHFHLIDKIAINNLLEVDGKVTGFFEKYNFAQGKLTVVCREC